MSFIEIGDKFQFFWEAPKSSFGRLWKQFLKLTPVRPTAVWWYLNFKVNNRKAIIKNSHNIVGYCIKTKPIFSAQAKKHSQYNILKQISTGN